MHEHKQFLCISQTESIRILEAFDSIEALDQIDLSICQRISKIALQNSWLSEAGIQWVNSRFLNQTNI